MHKDSIAVRPHLLNVQQAAFILQRSPRTVRYHAATGALRRINGFFVAEDVLALKERLTLYYREPFVPGSRSRNKPAIDNRSRITMAALGEVSDEPANLRTR